MPPNHFESEVESFLEGSHGDRTHIKRADHHTVTPLCGTLLTFFAHARSQQPFLTHFNRAGAMFLSLRMHARHWSNPLGRHFFQDQTKTTDRTSDPDAPNQRPATRHHRCGGHRRDRRARAAVPVGGGITQPKFRMQFPHDTNRCTLKNRRISTIRFQHLKYTQGNCMRNCSVAAGHDHSARDR